MTRESIRLIPHDPDDTLVGYVFRDEQHAREWLSQRFVKPDAYTLETVWVGPLFKCTKCGGSGFTQSVKRNQRITVAEFLHRRAPSR
jgi:hypothetical protein